LPRTNVTPFLQHIADALTGCVEIGPGTVNRVCREAQKKFFDPPELGNMVSKYR
jgi:hypothetical protein